MVLSLFMLQLWLLGPRKAQRGFLVECLNKDKPLPEVETLWGIHSYLVCRTGQLARGSNRVGEVSLLIENDALFPLSTQ